MPERVKPKRLLTGTIDEKLKPGVTLRVGSLSGPPVLWKLRSPSLSVRKTLAVWLGRDRSNAERGTMLTEPARAEPVVSGWVRGGLRCARCY